MIDFADFARYTKEKKLRQYSCYSFLVGAGGFASRGLKNSPQDCSACQKTSTLLYRDCRGDHWSPANLAQQRAFRDGFLTRHTGTGEQCSPLQEFFDSLKKQSAGLLPSTDGRPVRILPAPAQKKDPQPKLRVLFGGSWWIRTTEALSSRFTVCPHWPLGKAPIFCFVSAVSPGDVCYYSKGVSKLQAFF